MIEGLATIGQVGSHAAIANMAIYRHVLSANRMRIHYQDGRPPAVTQSSGRGAPGTVAHAVRIDEPINSDTGDYSESHSDIAVAGVGPALELNRTYSALAAKAGESSTLGNGWSFTLGASLSTDADGDATITNGNGSATEFTVDDAGDFSPPDGVFATLAHNGDGTYTYTVPSDHEIMTFDVSGRLSTISDLNGNALTLTYSVGGRLSAATNDAGLQLLVSYDAAGKISSVSDSSGRSVGYDYNASGDMVKATNLQDMMSSIRMTQVTYC